MSSNERRAETRGGIIIFDGKEHRMRAPQPIGENEDGRLVYRQADVVAHAEEMSHGGGVYILALRNERERQ